jgi:hypothetical protein
MAKRPRDPAQLAKQVFDIAIGEVEDTVSESKRNPFPRKSRITLRWLRFMPCITISLESTRR